MTNFENHRTDSSYEDALILKTFAFRFVNNYTPMFYIAFVQPFIPSFDPCTSNDCMKELQISLGTIFILKLLFNICLSIVYPIFSTHRHYKSHVKGMRMLFHHQAITNHVLGIPEEDACDMSGVELAHLKQDYDLAGGTLEDFATSVILYGYTTMFVSAFPLATCLSLMNSFIEMRLIAWQLCYVYRRPMPRGAQNMGIWYSIMEFMTVVAVVVNAGLIAFTANSPYEPVVQVWIFVGMSVLVLGVKFLIAAIIPDVPTKVTIQLKRTEFFTQRVIDNLDDDDTWEAELSMKDGILEAENVSINDTVEVQEHDIDIFDHILHT